VGVDRAVTNVSALETKTGSSPAGLGTIPATGEQPAVPFGAAWAVIAAVLLVASPSNGPDFGFYLDWSDAALSGDIFRLRGDVASPVGIPLTQWSAGTGLLFALGRLFLGPLVELRDGALAVGSISALVFWGSLLALLLRATSERGLVLFGLGAAFLGTHAGFYSLSHASESLAFGAGALMLALLTTRRPWGLASDVWMGGAAALLGLVRAQHVLYALPALLLSAARSWREQRGIGAARRVVGFGLLLLPSALVAAQTAIVHRWMTGSLLRSPYTFGGEGFTSLDWRDPEILAVLANPYHGLLAYHPLYGLGLVALVVCIAHAPSRDERAVWVAGLVAVAAHIYLHAAWHVWWLGTLTFGMRGMSLSAIVLVPALVRAVGRTRSGSARRALWLLASTLACLWSFLLLWQKYSYFYLWSDLLAAQASAAQSLLEPSAAAPLLFGVALVGLVAAWCRAGALHRSALGPAALLAGLSVGYLISRTLRRWTRRGAQEELRVEVLVLALLVLVCALVALEMWRLRTRHVSRAIQGGVGWAGIASLVASLGLFVGLAVKTEWRIAAGVPPPREFRAVSSVVLDQVREAYYEYEPIPGFDAKKDRLLRYLKANGIEP
jgi:hypothetical protein